jgi:hypothetical protein
MMLTASRKDTMTHSAGSGSAALERALKTVKCVKTFLRRRLPSFSRPNLFGVD